MIALASRRLEYPRHRNPLPAFWILFCAAYFGLMPNQVPIRLNCSCGK